MFCFVHATYFLFLRARDVFCFVHEIYLASLRAGDLSKDVHHHYLASRLRYVTWVLGVGIQTCVLGEFDLYLGNSVIS